MEGRPVSVTERARTAYDPVNTAVRSPKSTEYEAFARVTRSLKTADAQSGATGKAGHPALVAALHENRRLWNVLAANVAETDNELPPELRARIFYLAEFTVAHSRKVLRREATAGILVEINAAVMGGLRSRGAEA